MPRDTTALARDMQKALDLPLEEAELYINAIKTGLIAPKDQTTRALARSLSARGMAILDAKGEVYLPVHPRMAMSNLFRTYEEKAAMQRKERRLLVDKLTLELIPLLPGQSKGTNVGSPRGGRAR